MEADINLLDAARRMDSDALVQIFDLYARPLYAYAFRLCADSVMSDNIVGDVFAKLLDQLSIGMGPRTNLRSYLYETTYHIIVDDARYAHRWTSLDEMDYLYEYSTYMGVEDRQIFDKIMRAIRTDLTTDQRHVVVLRFLEGFSLRETAAIIGKEVGNVKVIQNRALAILRKAMDYVVI